MKLFLTCLLTLISASATFGQKARSSIADNPGFETYFRKNIRFPARAQEQGKGGRLYLYFTINKQGEFVDANVENPNGIDDLFVEEVKQVSRKVQAQGANYAGHYSLPISFTHSINNPIPVARTDKETRFLEASQDRVILNELIVEIYGPPMRKRI